MENNALKEPKVNQNFGFYNNFKLVKVQSAVRNEQVGYDTQALCDCTGKFYSFFIGIDRIKKEVTDESGQVLWRHSVMENGSLQVERSGSVSFEEYMKSDFDNEKGTILINIVNKDFGHICKQLEGLCKIQKFAVMAFVESKDAMINGGVHECIERLCQLISINKVIVENKIEEYAVISN